MGLKGIKYDEVCDRIKKLDIKGTKTEPLFLQLFMQALNKNGRCAVVVPDGVLFNDSVLHKNTRKQLIENYNLKKVVALNDDFFLNTGVKTSVLFFVNDEKTKKVEFDELKLKNGNVVETKIIDVKYDDLKKNAYSLHVNKYIVVEEEKIEGIEYKKLGDVCEFLIKSKRQASYGSEFGKYPFYTSGKKVLYCDEADYNDKCIIIGTGGNANIKYDNNFSCSADNFILKCTKDNIKYIYYYLNTNINVLENGFSGSTIKHISKDYVINLQIPIPSLKTQEEIVKRLDVLSSNIETSKKMIEEYKQIMKYYVDVQTRGEKLCNIKEVCSITSSGIRLTENNRKDGKYPYYGSNGIICYVSEYKYDGEYILTAESGTIGSVHYTSGKFFPAKDLWVLDPNKYQDKKYIFYVLKYNTDIMSLKTGIGIPHLSKKNLECIKLKIPSKEKQKQIVEYCDNISNMVTDVEKQIENNKVLTKNILETYLKDNKKKTKNKDDGLLESDNTDDSSSEEDEKPKKKKLSNDKHDFDGAIDISTKKKNKDKSKGK